MRDTNTLLFTDRLIKKCFQILLIHLLHDLPEMYGALPIYNIVVACQVRDAFSEATFLLQLAILAFAVQLTFVGIRKNIDSGNISRL